MTFRGRLLAVLMLPILAACASTPDTDTTPTPTGNPGATVTVDLDGRPFQLHVPGAYDRATKAPLVVGLHGFEGSAGTLEQYFKFTAESERHGFLYAMPDGIQDRRGDRFWNATDACCDFYDMGVDDSAYLRRLIDTVKSSYSVDGRRVYLVGHSNGGFMAYRMACDHATEITAVVSLAGAATTEADQCAPARPVSVLQIHGTADQTIQYEGGLSRRAYPSVDATLAVWRRYNGCGDQADTSAPPIDLDSTRDGAETTVTTYRTGCRGGTRVELWSIRDGGHIPNFTPDFAPAVAAFLLAHTSRA